MLDSCINYANILTILYIEIIHDIKGRKNIIVIFKDLVSLAQKIFNKVDRKRYPNTFFSANFVQFLRTAFLWKTSSGGIFSDENNIAKLAFDM